MQQRRSFGFLIGLAALVIGGGAVLAMRWQETMLLRSALELARMETADLQRLRADNRRLREKQIPAGELEALRADHAALPRLRAELEALKKAPRATGP